MNVYTVVYHTGKGACLCWDVDNNSPAIFESRKDALEYLDCSVVDISTAPRYEILESTVIPTVPEPAL